MRSEQPAVRDEPLPVTRILVLGLRYPPHHTGGYEVACRDVVEGLVERGHQVVVLTSDLREPGVVDPVDERRGPVPVRRDLPAWFRADALYVPGPLERWRRERAGQAALRATLDEVRPDVVFVWQMGALSLGLLATIAERGIPLVYAVFDDWLSYAPELDAWTRPFRRVPRPLARLARVVLRVPTLAPDVGASGVLCFISELTRARAEAQAPWSMPRHHDRLLRDRRSPLHPRATAAPPAGWEGHLLYAGRYDPRKGIATAIRAWPTCRVPRSRCRARATPGSAIGWPPWPRSSGWATGCASASSTAPVSWPATAPRMRSCSRASGRSPSASCPSRPWPAAPR